MNLFGWCSKIEDVNLLKDVGYDYIELPLATLELENKEAYKNNMKAIKESALPIRAFNFFFPPGLRVVGPDIDESRIRNYIAVVAQTMAETKASIVVLGSAGARNVPEDWERKRAEEQFLKVLSWCAVELRGTGTTLAIEPLNREESNFINSVAEGAVLAGKINRPEIKVLADFYHMCLENEPVNTLRIHKEWLAHVHIADTGRAYPGSGAYDFESLVSVLKEIEYGGMISVECMIEDKEKDMRRGMDFIKQMWK
jgi:sugar phosphate isomerase/epimerase